MGIMDFSALPPANTNASRSRPYSNLTNPDQPQAKLWLNVGYERAGKFVNLPIGMPVDTMKTAEMRGQNAEWIKFQSARNDLLKALQGLGAKLEPGQEIEVPNLVIKLRRTNEELDVTGEDNEYKVDLLSLLTTPAPQPIPQAAE